MTLRNDLIKHTIFLQRYASNEKNKLIKEITAIAENALLYADPSITTSMRKKKINDYARQISDQYKPDLKIYTYERNFIRKLLRKYGKENSLK